MLNTAPRKRKELPEVDVGVATIISPKKVKVIEEVRRHGRFDLLGKWLGNDGEMMVM
jgi:hypothetical protein